MLGGANATEVFKARKSMPAGQRKKFDENMERVAKVDGKEMTRLEVVEGIAKGEFDENALKLNKGEREYLQFLKENLIEPLRAIQNEKSTKKYTFSQVGMLGLGESKYSVNTINKGFLKDTATLDNLKKLTEVLGGKFEGKQFNFGSDDYKSSVFAKAATMFTGNEHSAYFGNNLITKTELENQQEDATKKAAVIVTGNELANIMILRNCVKKQKNIIITFCQKKK